MSDATKDAWRALYRCRFHSSGARLAAMGALQDAMREEVLKEIRNIHGFERIIGEPVARPMQSPNGGTLITRIGDLHKLLEEIERRVARLPLLSLEDVRVSTPESR